MVDAYSKWIEVHDMKTITAEATTERCRQTFATHGLPHTVVTDNGPTFTSSLFGSFLKTNGIRLIHSSPYHPATNGQAENAVKTVKNGLKRMKSNGTLSERLSRFLFHYRITPHTTTGQTTAELLMGRLPCSRLSLFRPDVENKVALKQASQARLHDRHSKGEEVFVKMFTNNVSRWPPGVVTRQLGPISYLVQLQNGDLVRRHLDHIRRRSATPVNEPRDDDDSIGVDDEDGDSVLFPELQASHPREDISGVTAPLPRDVPEETPQASAVIGAESSELGVAPPAQDVVKRDSPPKSEVQPLRRSSRTTKGQPPSRLGY